MNIYSKIRNKVNRLFRRYLLRDSFLIAAENWFRDKGDDTLRLNYPLNNNSVVFDLGGYHGDFAAAIHQKYGCNVYVFEPVLEFYEKCTRRFAGNEKISCFNYGLASKNNTLNIGLAENASSFESPHAQGAVQKVNVRSITESIHALNLNQIDLLKINIEGGEFDVIPALLDSGDISRIRYLQVQFHNFISQAVAKRTEIRSRLQLTHCEMWNYEFIWESWKIKDTKANS